MEEQQQIKLILEALLMTSDRPLSLKELAKILNKNDKKSSNDTLQAALTKLGEECASRAYELVETASGYRYQTRSDYAEWIAKLWEQRPPRYSRAALETLALIAYQQPITRAAIEDVRGVAVGTNIIRNFEDRGWIKVIGHKEVPGRPALYATTSVFLDDFGLSSLDGLPELPEPKLLTDNLPVHLVPDEPKEEAEQPTAESE